jgi:hypothetical protein
LNVVTLHAATVQEMGEERQRDTLLWRILFCASLRGDGDVPTRKKMARWFAC